MKSKGEIGSNIDKDLGSRSPRSLEEVKKAFSKIFGVPAAKLPFRFSIDRTTGEIVARQSGYISDYDKWFRIYNYTREVGGRSQKSRDDGRYYFTFPLIDRSSIDPPHEENELRVTPGFYPEFPVDRILSSPFSFRANIAEGIDELVSQVYSAGMIVEPLVCRPKRGGYVEVGPGERRLCAAKQMAIKKVPVIVKEFTDAEFDKVRLLENLARKDLTDMEIARVLGYLLKKYPEEYPTQQALGDAFGKTKGWVSQHLQMLDLEDFWTKNMSKFTRVNFEEIANRITEFQARQILSVSPEKRGEVARKIAERIEAEGKIPSGREIHDIVHPEEEPSEPTESKEEQTKPTLNKSVVLEALEETLFSLYPEGVELEKIRSELSEFDTSNLSDLLFELANDGTIVLEKGRFMLREQYEREQVLGRLRTEIRAAEELLVSEYEGFQENRGLETYKVSEVRQVAKRNGPTKEFLDDLRKCVDLHKEFYRVYNRQQAFMALRNDVATVNIDRIDRYLRSAKPKPVKTVDWKAVGKFCPLCKTLISERTYERLKRKFTGEVADKIAEKFGGKVPSVREIFEELFRK